MASWEGALAEIDRRTALGVGLGVAAALIADPRSAALAAVGDETKIAEGVTAKTLGEGPSIIPGFANVRLRDITMQPGSVLVHKSAVGRGSAAAIAVYQAMRCDTGMPSRVIRL